MRKPFLFFLLLISLWAWSTDIVDIACYYCHYHYSPIEGGIASVIIFLPLAYCLCISFLKYFELQKKDIKITTDQLKEFALLVVVFLPIVYLNYERIMFPDADYDVQAYHMFLHTLNRLDNLRNFNMVGTAGGGTYFFTLPYKMYSVFRVLLGYRMGTIFNTFLLFFIYVSVYDFLKQFVVTFLPERIPVFFIVLSALFIIFADNTLFNLNSYKIDSFGVPLLLELVNILFFKPLHEKNKTVINLYFFIIASLIITYKLTYLPYVLIIGVFFLIRNYKTYVSDKKLVLFFLLTLLFPSIYLLYNYSETLNPIFPFYNKIFKSPLYPIQNFKDERWGPKNVWEFFTYNIITISQPQRTGEYNFFSVRLLTEYLIIFGGIGTLVYNKFSIKDNGIKAMLYLSLIAILCNYSLIYTTGYYRYGIFIEVIFGILLILVLYYLYAFKKWIIFSLLTILLLIQSINTFNRIYRFETNLSWYPYDFLRNNNTLFSKECGRMFNDYNSGVDSTVTNLKIDAYLTSDHLGFIKLFSPNIPIYNLPSGGPRQALIDSVEKNKMDTLSQQHNVYLIASMFTVIDKIKDLNSRNYYVDSIIDVYPTFTLTNEPIYFLKLKYYNKKSYKISNECTILATDSTNKSSHFFYTSRNKFKSYIIEDPYMYNLPKRDSSNFTANNILYNAQTKDNKITTIPKNNDLSFINHNDLQYIIVIQELQNIIDTIKIK
jgi:hypothetical protein